MWAFVVGCCAVAWALGGWHSAPAHLPGNPPAFGAAIGLSVLFAYWCGTRRNRARAVAAAVARAEANAAAVATGGNAAATVVQHFHPAREWVGQREVLRQVDGLDRAPWMVGAHRAVELDETEAVDAVLADVLEDREADVG